MLEKLFLAVTMTFCLNIFLAAHSPNTNIANGSHQVVEKPTSLVKLLIAKSFQRQLPPKHPDI